MTLKAGVISCGNISKLLDIKVTMNGNIHTVNTLIRGTTNDVRHETPEENICAMIGEAN